MNKPLIVTAELDASDFEWLDRLRRRYFPPERNYLRAHLTMFHALPPSVEEELTRLLSTLTGQPRPDAMLSLPYSLGREVAFRIASRGLESLRHDIAQRFHGCLTAQDAQGWRPHVTIQNKVEPTVARKTLNEVANDFEPRSIKLIGLGLYRYDGGPWQPVRRFAFRG